MAVNLAPKTPLEAYEAIVDQLVEDTNGVSERLIREERIFSRSTGAQAQNAFVKSLTKEQRNLLAQMIRDERVSGIGAVLANLTWWLSCRKVRLTFRGKPMPFDLSGMGIHGDYIGRLDDWEWPEKGPGPAKG